MSQHLIREIQQLKHQVNVIKEEEAWMSGLKDTLLSIQNRLERIEHTLGIDPGMGPPGPGANPHLRESTVNENLWDTAKSKLGLGTPEPDKPPYEPFKYTSEMRMQDTLIKLVDQMNSLHKFVIQNRTMIKRLENLQSKNDSDETRLPSSPPSVPPRPFSGE